MPDRRLIYKKLEEILKQLKYLQKLSRLSEREFVLQETQQFLAERVMERLIGAAIDINMHIIADLTGEVPAHYFTSFLELARLKIYPLSFAKKIGGCTTVRDILVHEYQELNLKKFRQSIKSALRDFPKYVKHIEKFVD